MNEQLTCLGMRLKELRRKRLLTLQQLAERTELTAGLLSKIENFRTIPSLPVLLSIARALEVDLSVLFEGITFKQRKPWTLIHEQEQFPVEREDSTGLEYNMILESALDSDSFQVMLVTVAPGADREPVAGEGRELLYLLSGTVEYQVGEEKIEMHSGDTLFFDGTLPHVPHNSSKSKAVMLVFYFLKSSM